MKFSTIVADPPWPYKSGGRFSSTTVNPYQTPVSSRARYGAMSLKELGELDVAGVANDNAHLYLWTTNAFIAPAHDLARAWGFDPITIITRVKTKVGDYSPSMAMGWYYRSASEHIVFCVRGKLRLLGPAEPTVFFAHRGAHSVKPEESYLMVERQSPGPYLELFARKRRPGWSAFGNGVDADVLPVDLMRF